MLDPDGTGNNNKQVWSVSGDKGNNWNLGSILIGSQKKGFRLQFEAEVSIH